MLEPLAPTQIVWKPEVVLSFHPNGMLFEALRANEVFDSWTIFSTGGGTLANAETPLNPQSIYPMSRISDILTWCTREGKTFWEYVQAVSYTHLTLPT